MHPSIQKAVKVLHEGGVVAHPTETCYGLAVDIFNKTAVKKLYSVKKMAFDKPVSILVRDLEEAMLYGIFNEKAKELAGKHWPGPLTIIVPKTDLVPYWINEGLDSIGIRVSSNKMASALVDSFGAPITSTSANIHGMPEAYDVADFLAQALVPDEVVDSGKIGKTPPSTIVKVNGENLELIRKGPIDLS